MSRILKLGIGILLGVIAAGLVTYFLSTNDIAVLNPEGAVGSRQRDLIIVASLLILLVIIPVFAMAFGIAWKYRASNTKAKYSPDWDHSHLFESIWWGVPIAIIIVLGVIAWKSSHDLDPYRALESNVKPLRVQVIALQWKWLFLYPEQGIATVNHLQIPERTPINFEITSDAPMNAFWVPKLGSQVYAMAGMTTKLHLIADNPGTFPGSSANISGEGFADMKFNVKATSQEEFDRWVDETQRGSGELTYEAYDSLVLPKIAQATSYAYFDPGLYDRVIMKYMMPADTDQAEHTHEVSHEH